MYKSEPGDVSPNLAYRCSIVSFVGLLAMFATFPLLQKFPDIIYLSTYFAVAFHLALLPIVAFMPAPTWTKIGGYTWVAMDVILAVAGLNGIPNTTIEPFRFGVHVILIVWPVGLAISNSGLLKWSSIGFAITTGSVPLMGTAVSPMFRFIGLPFILLWFVSVIIFLGREKREIQTVTYVER